MAQTEKTLQKGIQDFIQALSAFDNANVTINDWTFWDDPGVNGPWLVIQNSDDFSSQPGTSEQGYYEIPAIFVEYLANKSWKEAMDNFRDNRQAIRTAVNNGANSTAGGLAETYISEMRAESEIVYRDLDGNDPALDPDAIPMYAMQSLIFRVEFF